MSDSCASVLVIKLHAIREHHCWAPTLAKCHGHAFFGFKVVLRLPVTVAACQLLCAVIHDIERRQFLFGAMSLANLVSYIWA